MEKKINLTDEQLLNYLDGQLNDPDNATIEKLLTDCPATMARLEELRFIHNYLSAVKLDEPSVNFARQVMNRISQPLPSGYTARNGIFLLAGVLIAVGIAVLLLAGGVFDTTTLIDLNQMLIPGKFIDSELPVIMFNGKIIVNLIIVANIALAFVVLDRTILKPWFERRKNLNAA